MNTDLLTSAEACEALGYKSRSDLTRRVQMGQIAAAVKLPGKRGAYLFDPDEIARFKAQREEPAA